MSTVSTIPAPQQPPPSDDHSEDPFRYGWRYVRVQQPDGTETFDQIPLTLEDVLHPETGDFIVQTDSHWNDVAYLKFVFKSRLANDPHAAVVTDCRIDWKVPKIRPLGPDVTVFFGVKQYRDWATLNVADEGAQTALVAEVTSPSTRQNDVGIKFDYYHRVQVPFYILADVRPGNEAPRRLELSVYRYQPEAYEKIAPDEKGRVLLEPVGVLLGVVRNAETGGDRLACYDPATGAEIGDYLAVARAAAEERARADMEAARADTQAARADTEAARADAEAARADTEALARAAAETRAAAESQARADAETRAAAESQARSAAEARAAAQSARTKAEAQARIDAEARAAAAEARLRELESARNPGP